MIRQRRTLRTALPDLGIPLFGLVCLGLLWVAGPRGLAAADMVADPAGRDDMAPSAARPASISMAADSEAEQWPIVVRRGYLVSTQDTTEDSVDVMQHPTLFGSRSPWLDAGPQTHQDYLNVFDADGDWDAQIVLLFADDAPRPSTPGRPVEVRGRLGRIDLGGPEGTKSSYANDAVHVISWRYLSTRDVPARRPARD